MRLVRVEEALEECQNHLTSTGAFGTAIEHLLSYALLVVIFAEFEQTVEKTIREKYDAIQDDSLKAFFRSFSGRDSRRILPRGIKTSELAEFLARFGETYKSQFRTKLEENQRQETYYNNLIVNRHDTAHSSGSNATFLDIQQFYQEGHSVLDCFRETLLNVDHDE